ncbi:hypothetical protein LR48_Vigan06g083900 [Vigna angularis]|uniref:Uncharacterized protein n=1 Tax=Phaseolus angularis TaxID=3914 RepID=A0A0L9US14_PHAAN|nr:hypothetical protein LR48_Vigan06g083900 [Vigna angularis]
MMLSPNPKLKWTTSESGWKRNFLKRDEGKVVENLGKTHAQEKIRLSEYDPLGALQQLADIIANKPLEVEYDANVFGRGSKVPINLHSQDVRELASRTKELNITLVQRWMMYMFGVSNNLGYNDVYGFIDPQVIHETNDFDEITTYLTSRFASGKNIHFISYISGTEAAAFKVLPRLEPRPKLPDLFTSPVYAAVLKPKRIVKSNCGSFPSLH